MPPNITARPHQPVHVAGPAYHYNFFDRGCGLQSRIRVALERDDFTPPVGSVSGYQYLGPGFVHPVFEGFRTEAGKDGVVRRPDTRAG